MTEMTARFKVSATAEVRDKDGNLISSTPVTFDDVPPEMLESLGLSPDDANGTSQPCE